VDTEQKIMLRNVIERKGTLEKDAEQLISTAVPQIEQQHSTIENYEKRLGTAKTTFDDQTNMVLLIKL
jgi:hypothetical protein